MCVNFTATPKEKLAYFNLSAIPETDYHSEIWQDYAAPIVLQNNQQGRVAVLASYGMVPQNHLPAGQRYSTMNARLESIAEKRSYAGAWRQAQRCLVPMSAFFEPSYETGKAQRWRIGVKTEAEHARFASAETGHAEFAVAGLYQSWQDQHGQLQFAFTQVTINADQHDLMQRFHKPGDEKRSLVILPPEHYDDWLTDRNPDFARALLTLYPAAQMWSEPAPLARKEKTLQASSDQANPATASSAPMPQQHSLF